MDVAEFIDKVLTPLAGGLGMFVATRLSPQMRQQSTTTIGLQVVAVVLILGGLKWSNVI